MPTASRATNKTDFQRYINDHPQVVSGWSVYYKEYEATPHKRTGNGLFGFWIRRKYPAKFMSAYRLFWLKHPDLHEKVYDNVVQECAGGMPSYHQQY